MHDVEGRVTVVFNGEIYNYAALRRDLERKGYTFASDSDTEVLICLYLDEGRAMVERLRGMYAFALWDARREGLFLARDPYGIKPLYVAKGRNSIHIASQVKALHTIPGVDTRPDPAGHVGFFLWGHVPEPYTLYRGIRMLPAGHTQWADRDGVQPPQPFANLPAALRRAEHAPSPNGRSPREHLRAALKESVAHHLVADVDVGLFLSAGRDSATLAALVAEEHDRLRTVTLGFEEFRGTAEDEVPGAERLAAHYGTQHETVWVRRRDFADAHDDVLAAMDQPTIDGVNSYFVSRAAHQVGLKVALSGLGGDELFGGYPSFREIPRLVAALGRVPAGAAPGARPARGGRPAGAPPHLTQVRERARIRQRLRGRPTCCAAASTCRGSSPRCSTPTSCARAGPPSNPLPA